MAPAVDAQGHVTAGVNVGLRSIHRRRRHSKEQLQEQLLFGILSPISPIGPVGSVFDCDSSTFLSRCLAASSLSTEFMVTIVV